MNIAAKPSIARASSNEGVATLDLRRSCPYRRGSTSNVT
jgi:hypothetical protein